MKKGLLKLFVVGLLVSYLGTDNTNAQSLSFSTSVLSDGSPANGNTGSYIVQDVASSVDIYQIGTQGRMDGELGVCLEVNNNNNSADPAGESIQITSTDKKIIGVVLSYRGNGASANAKPYMRFGESSASLTGCRIEPVDGVTSATPVDVLYNLSDEAIDTKFVIFARANATTCGGATSSQTTFRVYRIDVYLEGDVLPLPLDIISFTAKPDALGKSVNLNWETTNEVNTKEFIVEKRTDDTEFTAIGTKASNNTAGVHNYNYTDNNATAGNAYYRLKQVDNDGKYTYSDVVQVNVQAGLSLSVYPNPVDGVLNITHAAATKASVKILSLEGKTLVKQSVAAGANSTSLNATSLVAGTYLLVYEDAGQKSTLKFTKK